MLGKSTHLQVISQQSTQTQQICHYRHARKTSELFLLHNTGIDFSSRNNVANLGSFAKVSAPDQSIIPCCILTNFVEFLKTYDFLVTNKPPTVCSLPYVNIVSILHLLH